MAARYQQVRIPISGRLYKVSNSARSSNMSLHFPAIDEPTCNQTAS